MDWTSLATNFSHDLLSHLFDILATAITGKAVEWLNAQIARANFGKLQAEAQMLVDAAMQTMSQPERVSVGKDWVMSQLLKTYPKEDKARLDATIEACVNIAKTRLVTQLPPSKIVVLRPKDKPAPVPLVDPAPPNPQTVKAPSQGVV